MANEINELWIFVSEDQFGNEGLVLDESARPLVTSDVEQLETLMPIARKFAAAINRPVRVLHALGLEQIFIIEPPKEG